MNRFLIVAAVLLAGCVQSGGGGTDPVPTPPPATATVWTALADRIEGGKVKNTDELVLIVRQLKADGDIDESQLSAFNALGLEKKNEPATKSVADRVRELK
jgi:hypothetical protein